MRSFFLIFLFWALSSAGFAESMGSRYYRKGGSSEHRRPYTDHQSYQSRSEHSGQHLPQQSRFQTRWELENRYRLDAYGKPIAGGTLQGDGGAERIYVHDNSPEQLQSIESKEAEVTRKHLEYLKYIEDGNRQIGHYRMEIEKLKRDDSDWAKKRLPGDEAMIRANESLNRVFRRWNNEALSGNP